MRIWRWQVTELIGSEELLASSGDTRRINAAVPESVPGRGPTPVQQHPAPTKLYATGLKSASSGVLRKPPPQPRGHLTADWPPRHSPATEHLRQAPDRSSVSGGSAKPHQCRARCRVRHVEHPITHGDAGRKVEPVGDDGAGAVGRDANTAPYSPITDRISMMYRLPSGPKSRSMAVVSPSVYGVAGALSQRHTVAAPSGNPTPVSVLM